MLNKGKQKETNEIKKKRRKEKKKEEPQNKRKTLVFCNLISFYTTYGKFG
jgi:hypothetical protein